MAGLFDLLEGQQYDQSPTTQPANPPTGYSPWPVPQELWPIFSNVAQQYNLSPYLLPAIAGAETGGTYNPNLKSPAGAQGLMQLMPSMSKNLGVSNPYDPQQAIPAAGKAMQWALNWAEGKAGGQGYPALEMALKAYNNGPFPNRWNNPETQGYPNTVMQYFQQLQNQVQQAQVPNYMSPVDSGGF